MIKNCSQCKFWVANLYDDRGECRRYAPTLLQKNNSNTANYGGDHYGQFPMTYSNVWCGEFKKAE